MPGKLSELNYWDSMVLLLRYKGNKLKFKEEISKEL